MRIFQADRLLYEGRNPKQIWALAPDGEFFQSALAFLGQWLSGQESFPVATSGSTGQPKTFRASRQRMAKSAALTHQALHLPQQPRCLVCLAPRYIAGQMMLVRCAEWNADTHLAEPNARPLRGLALPQLDFAAMVPYQAQQTLEKGSPQETEQLRAIDCLLLGGAALPPALEQALQTFPRRVFHSYGMSETLTHVALRRVNGPQASEAFTLLPEVEAGVTPEGTLWLESPLSEQQRIQTTDIVEFTGPRTFKVLGRADFAINSAGVKLHPERAEGTLEGFLSRMGHPRRVLVYPRSHPQRGEAPHLLVEGKPLPETAFSLENFRQEIAAQLGPYYRPESLQYLEHFPETPTGKVDRKAALQQLQETPNR